MAGIKRVEGGGGGTNPATTTHITGIANFNSTGI